MLFKSKIIIKTMFYALIFTIFSHIEPGLTSDNEDCSPRQNNPCYHLNHCIQDIKSKIYNLCKKMQTIELKTIRLIGIIESKSEDLKTICNIKWGLDYENSRLDRKVITSMGVKASLCEYNQDIDSAYEGKNFYICNVENKDRPLSIYSNTDGRIRIRLLMPLTQYLNQFIGHLKCNAGIEFNLRAPPS